MALAVVTGAAGGIGGAVARRLARDGYDLALLDVAEAPLAAIAAELGPRVRLSRVVDLRDPAAVASFGQAVLAIAVPDVVVNNAGVGVAGPFVRATADDWRWIVDVNLLGPVYVLQALLPAMIERRRGHVVNVVSVLGYFAPPGVSPYVATKYGLLGLTQSLRTELLQKGVRVSAVCPGLVGTGIAANARVRTEGVEARARVESLFRRGRDPSVVADAIAGLLHRDRAVLPVGLEAWALWYAGRVSPDLGTWLGRSVLRRVIGRDAVRQERDAMGPTAGAGARSTR